MPANTVHVRAALQEMKHACALFSLRWGLYNASAGGKVGERDEALEDVEL